MTVKREESKGDVEGAAKPKSDPPATGRAGEDTSRVPPEKQPRMAPVGGSASSGEQAGASGEGSQRPAADTDAGRKGPGESGTESLGKKGPGRPRKVVSGEREGTGGVASPPKKKLVRHGNIFYRTYREE